MLLTLIGLERPAGRVFENGTENLNGVFVVQKSAIWALLESKSLSSCRMGGGKLCCYCLVLHNTEAVGLWFAHLFSSFMRESQVLSGEPSGSSVFM